MIDNLTADTPDGPIETVLINCHYPITGDSFMLQYGVMVKKLPGMSDEQAEAMAQQFGSANLASFEQDIKIWRTKAKVDNPLLCEEDGPVYQLRRWYEQFYVDVEDITDDMIRRFEFEIDTTRSGQHWDEEMVANRAAAATADRQSNAGIR
jgi:hypothetical protein